MADHEPSVPDAVEPPATSPPESPPLPEPPVSDPTKLIRIASMTRAVLEELRQAPIDHEACRRILDIHKASLEELREVLSEDLREEFDDIFAPFEGEPSEGSLRIANAQLIGWMEGLFHGIQATIATQQMLAANQLNQMRGRQSLPGGSNEGDGGEYPGVYL